MADQLSRLFAALADPTRRDIVARLAVGDATVGQLAAPYEVSVQAVSKHLKVLEDAGLVSRSRDAQRRPVHLESEVLELMTSWIERYRRAAEERYRRLDAVLAEMNAEKTPGRTPTRTRSRPHEHRDRGPHRGRPDRPDHPHHPRLRRDPRAAVPGAHRPGALRPLGGAGLLRSRIDHWDARTGGSWRYVATHGDDEHAFRGCFHEVRPDRIVQTFTWEGMPDAVALETLVFEDLGDGRTRLHASSLCDSFAARDGWLQSGMEVGINEGYAKLDGLLRDGAV